MLLYALFSVFLRKLQVWRRGVRVHLIFGEAIEKVEYACFTLRLHLNVLLTDAINVALLKIILVNRTVVRNHARIIVGIFLEAGLAAPGTTLLLVAGVFTEFGWDSHKNFPGFRSLSVGLICVYARTRRKYVVVVEHATVRIDRNVWGLLGKHDS